MIMGWEMSTDTVTGDHGDGTASDRRRTSNWRVTRQHRDAQTASNHPGRQRTITSMTAELTDSDTQPARAHVLGLPSFYSSTLTAVKFNNRDLQCTGLYS